MTAIETVEDRFASVPWRLNNLYMIVDERGHRVPFRLNWAQEDLLNEMSYLNVVLKARQLGFTTFILLYMLDKCIFNSDVHAGTIAHNREDAEAYFRDKVKFPYDNLDEALKEANPAVQDSTRQLTFRNNSSIRVGTSMRSGTLQVLHVSEYGKTCAKFPDKAMEIRTGAFNTVHLGQEIFVESTAEGQAGDFYDMCDAAQTLKRRGVHLTELDFKFHFYPWWKHPGYAMAPEGVEITAEMGEYFEKLAKLGIQLTHRQRAWYAKKAVQQRLEMKREYPSTPEEAFEAAIAGAYYGDEMARVEADKRILDIVPERGLPVEVWWDLGMNDLMTMIWVQRANGWFDCIDYYQNSGLGFAHYVEVLQEKQRERRLVYADPSQIWPHDGNTRLLDEHGRKRTEVMRGLGYEPRVIKRQNLAEGIEATRNLLPHCRFDATRCDKLVRALKSYRREWDEETATFRKIPLHDWASHPADAMRTGAMYKPVRGDFHRKLKYQPLPIA